MKLKLLMVFLCFVMVSCSDNSKTEAKPSEIKSKGIVLPEITSAKEYRVLKIETFPASNNRSRYRVIAYSESAKTFVERAQTAIKVAAEHQKKTRSHEVQVWLEAIPNGTERIAIADYYPYDETAWGEKPPYKWQVEASDAEVTQENIKDVFIYRKRYLDE